MIPAIVYLEKLNEQLNKHNIYKIPKAKNMLNTKAMDTAHIYQSYELVLLIEKAKSIKELTELLEKLILLNNSLLIVKPV